MDSKDVVGSYSRALRVLRFDDEGRYPGFPEKEAPWFPPRSAWGEGPWMAEPDLVEWRDAATPYPLLIVRGDIGALCGYVGVPPGHPGHGQNAQISISSEGITARRCCHGLFAPTGEPPDCWWLGFDCGHIHVEIAPLMEAGLGGFFEGHGRERHYVTLDECRQRTEGLAIELQQIAQLHVLNARIEAANDRRTETEDPALEAEITALESEAGQLIRARGEARLRDMRDRIDAAVAEADRLLGEHRKHERT